MSAMATANEHATALAGLHKLLQIQLGGLPDGLLEREPALAATIQKISRTYTSFERDRALSEHAYNVSEQEYQTLMAQLRQQSLESAEYVRQVRNALAALQDDYTDSGDGKPATLSDLLRHLQERIDLTKRLERDLMQAKLLAEEAARAKSEFLSVMSHEIRTPLNAVIGLAYLMNHEADPAAQAESLALLTRSCENLLGLVTDVLDFNKLEERRIELHTRPTALRKLLETVRQTHGGAAKNQGITLALDIGPDIPALVLADDFRLQQILNNLVGNAVKFTPQGSVTLRALADGEVPERILFSVDDTGIGMSEAEQRRAFDRFSQASADTSRRFGGSGLGLAIVRELVELHGGRIHLESAPGVGSRFYFTLHLPAAQPTQKPPPPSLTIADLPRLDDLAILLAEDLPLNVLVAQRLLQRQGASVAIATDGYQAVSMAQANPYAIILMDIQMPGMDGLAAARVLREAGHATPIIALSADTSPATRTRATQAGMDAFVAKPFNPGHLVETIVRLVRQT